MKKIIIMTLAVMVFGTVSFAKGNGAEDKNKSAEKVEAVDLGLSVKWANMKAMARISLGVRPNRRNTIHGTLTPGAKATLSS